MSKIAPEPSVSDLPAPAEEVADHLADQLDEEQYVKARDIGLQFSPNAIGVALGHLATVPDAPVVVEQYSKSSGSRVWRVEPREGDQA